MTVLLKKAFERAKKLPKGEQDKFARHMLAELESEERWTELFNRPQSEEILSRLADQSLKAHRSDATKLLDPEDL
ncbi:MAG: hypothetical protein BMS9Abin05_2358 [Rhodothermia bacterium]|nr:MAG: hypothetical protein BMS9Abin05_2358 [Rhodothermia bacterium]